MQSESRIDPKIIEEILKFSKNVIDAPKLVSAPDEISLEVTPHDVVQEIDKTNYYITNLLQINNIKHLF
jgi:hypothetical protein